MNPTRTVGIGQQVYTNFYAGKPNTTNAKENRFSGQSNPGKSASAQVLFGFAPDPVGDRLKRLEQEALKNKSPLEQLIYRIGQLGKPVS